MIRQSKNLLAAAAVVLGVAGCFSDPTSSLRNGSVALTFTARAITLTNGDSTTVQGVVLDAQGNPQAVTSATWTSADPSVAVVREDSERPAPGAAFTRVFIRGATNQAGVTTVTLVANGVTDSVRVTVLPATFPGTVSITGTAVPDTIINVPPPPAAPDTTIFTAGDTIEVNATSTVTFDPAASVIMLGPNATTLIARSATQLVAIAAAPYSGPATVTNLTYSGTPQTGAIELASLSLGTVQLARNRFTFTPTVVTTASAFGANTQMTITAPATASFAATSAVSFGGSPAIVLSRTGTTAITVIASNSYTGPVTVSNVTYGLATLTLNSAASVSINASNFPGTVTNNVGNLLDTIVVNSGASATFTTAATAPGPSLVILGSDTAFILSRSATTITAIAKHGITAPVKVTRVVVAGVTVPALLTTASLVVSPTATGEPNEPGNQSSATATAAFGSLAAVGDSAWVFGVMDAVADARDYYMFTMPVTGALNVHLAWFGNGSGADDDNPDHDVVICTTLSGSATCSYGQDLVASNGASSVSQPESGTTSVIPAGTVVFVRTFAYYGTAAGPNGVYRLRLRIQ